MATYLIRAGFPQTASKLFKENELSPLSEGAIYVDKSYKSSQAVEAGDTLLLYNGKHHLTAIVTALGSLIPLTTEHSKHHALIKVMCLAVIGNGTSVEAVVTKFVSNDTQYGAHPIVA